MKPPALWRKKKDGKFSGSYFAKITGEDVNLSTKNAELARQRLVEALRGKRTWPSDAELAAQALEADIEGAAAAEPDNQAGEARKSAQQPPAAAPPGPVVPDHIEPPRALPPIPASSADEARAEAEATNAAAAETGGAAGEAAPPPPPEVSNEELAALGVEAQLWVAQQYARSRVWQGYMAPQLPPEAKAPLAAQWEKLIAYANVGAMLPPWVVGLVIPGVTIVISTAALGQVFAEQAAQQKKAAGVQDDSPADPASGKAAA